MQAEGIEPDGNQRYRAAAAAEFGRFVFNARRRAGQNQEQFAERLSVHQAEISRMERGDSCPRLDTVVRVMTGLEADPRELVKAIADACDFYSTSYVERQNLTMRMGMRRFTRLTNGFSRKVENLAHAVSLHFMHYNFARPHRTLKERYPRTPAMAAGVADHIWSLEEIAALLD